jgi:peptidoglycan-associated lipoprotein
VAAAPARAEPAAPTPQQVDADLEGLLRGDVLHFGFDEAQLTSESEQRLQKLAEAMRSHPDVKLTVAGNCDELGTEEYNLALGQKRAAVAKAYLVRLGVDGQRVATVSYGKERPVNPGHDEQARAANRRDDLTLQRL